MEDIRNVRLAPLKDSNYLKPFRFLYTQNGTPKSWDLLGVHDSVGIIIYNITRKVLVLVKQFRPAVYYSSVHPDNRKDTIDTDKYPGSLGTTLELCAGIVDKNKSLLEIAREEALEECGYDIPADKMEEIATCRSGVGEQSALFTVFFCEVTDDMKTGAGGGIENELIEIVEKTIPEMEEMMNSPGPLASPPGFLYAIMWFLHHKAGKYKN
ncbi:hypothetical protein MSG28_007168 [Choristoneura fumiferana]|uniref:Uncharacterized protein n=2 Tax=Choristoneura fumiferana TaxID=7141 RepID=A0ACC0JMP4_CHOFU|nr:hypothetical protein MSG28_007166 [Choristoneura fumiferana]KAI8425421.1 hypothetical protein MSG28_007168 [Choristoneura fumiferana]